MKDYVCGFLIHDSTEVALIKKRHGPQTLIGKLNGIGGKIERGEFPATAMEREFLEETGHLVPRGYWRRFCELQVSSFARVYFYMSHTFGARPQLLQTTDEEVGWYVIGHLPLLNTVPNLRWLLPMALDKDFVVGTVYDPSEQK